MLKDVLEYFPNRISFLIKNFIKEKRIEEKNIEEIRVRINQFLYLKIKENFEQVNYMVWKNDIEEIFENICEKSVYTYINQIVEGFITIKGGNRVGIVGSCVIENGQVKNINYISSLNFRIAKQIKDASIPFLKYIIDYENNTIYNTLIASSPGGGKTTLLRDLAMNLSNRNK